MDFNRGGVVSWQFSTYDMSSSHEQLRRYRLRRNDFLYSRT